MRLKIRSPCKSPSKNVPSNKRLIVPNEILRTKSPKNKDKQRNLFFSYWKKRKINRTLLICE